MSRLIIQTKIISLLKGVIDTIDATRERLLPLLIKANEERYLTPKEVAKQLGIGLTSVYNRIKDGKLKPIKMGKSTRFNLMPETGCFVITTALSYSAV